MRQSRCVGPPPRHHAVVLTSFCIRRCDKRFNAGKHATARPQRHPAPRPQTLSGPNQTPTTLGELCGLTALWLITHEGDLLETERGLEPGVDPCLDTWDATVLAARQERFEDLPVPVRLVREWGAPEELTDEAARGCLRDSASQLPQVVDEIERVWGGGKSTDVAQEVARAVASIAVLRHMQVQRGFRPVPGEKASIWYEVQQGIRRPETMERAELLRRLRAVLLRCECDPLAVAAAHIDCAGENQARGVHDQTRAELAQAMHWTSKYEGEHARRDHGAVCVAQFLWLAGEPEEAMLRLARLEGEGAAQLLHAMDARKEERAALLVAEADYRQNGDLVSWCALGNAHLAAGHNVRAELVARDICEQHPETGLTQGFLASILFELERYRDAVAPARKALELGLPNSAGRALLARSLARIGPDGREEAVALAVEVIEAEDAMAAVAPEDLAELAETVHYGGGNIHHARRADDLLWEHRARNEPPSQWLGAAAARRCHDVWAEDATEWLSRLSGAALHELARFVVDRVEALLYWQSSIEPSPPVGAEAAGDEGFPGLMSEADRKLARRTAREEAVGEALRAAIALGYAEPDLDDGYERSGSEIAPAVAWEPHVAEIASCFGDELAIRLRASELAQPVVFGSGEAGEHEYLVALETLVNERVAWIRWAVANDALANPDAISRFSPTTRARLETVLELARAEDDEEVRGAGSGCDSIADK